MADSKFLSSQNMTVVKFLEQVNESERPTLSELTENITPLEAAEWRTIGILLKFSMGELDIIDHDCHHQAKQCCTRMLSKWLEEDENATWKKLKDIFSSKALTCKKGSNELKTHNGIEICDHQANAIYCIARIIAPSWKLVSGALNIPRHVINNIYEDGKKNCVVISEKLIKYWFETESAASVHVLLNILDEPYIMDELKEKITLIQTNLSGMPVNYPDIFPRPIAENYTCMKIKVIKILKSFPDAHEELLLLLQYYPDKNTINKELFKNTKNANEVIDTLENEGLLSPINIHKLLFLVKSINCIQAQKAIEAYEESIDDKPITDELMWCLGQCQSPRRCFLYARLIGDPKISTYRDLKKAKAGISQFADVPVHNMIDTLQGKGSTIIFWEISEEDAQKTYFSQCVPLSLKQTLCEANIIELGICYKEKQQSVYVEQLVVTRGIKGSLTHTIADKRNQEIYKAMLNALNADCSIPVRYGKVLFCGAPAVGKSSFINLLIKDDFESSYKNTKLLKESQQAIAIKAEISSNDCEVEFEKVTVDDKILELKLYLQEYAKTSDGKNFDAEPKNKKLDKLKNTNACAEHEDSSIKDNMKLALGYVNSEKELSKKCKGKVWDILTFMDTGGQPQFISMLPTVNSFAMITFIVHKMEKGGQGPLNETVRVQYRNEKGENFCTFHPHGYTCLQLIETLISYTSNTLLPNTGFLDEVKILSRGKNKSVRSMLLVGTHSGNDQLKERDMIEIDKELQKLVDYSKANHIKGELNRNYKFLVPVDNKKQGQNSEFQAINTDTVRYTMPSKIRHYIYKFLENQDTIYVPITWLLLELEIRKVCQEKNCSFISYKNVSELAKNKKFAYDSEFGVDAIDSDEFIKQALRFHHLFGMLLYFENVEGIPELVITNHQWLFDKLSEIVKHSFTEGYDHDAQDEIKDFRRHGIITKWFLHVHSNGISKDFKDSGIDIKLNDPINIFLSILQHLKIVAPSSEDGQTYFMPFVLKSGELDNLKEKIPGYHTNKMNPLFIQFKSKGDKTCLFPRGVFCSLIVELMLSKKWKPLTPAYVNFITLVKRDTLHYVTLVDNKELFCLEIHVIHPHKENYIIHNIVRKDVVTALETIAENINFYSTFRYGFPCSCKEMHIAYLTEDSDQFCCCAKGSPIELNILQRYWLENAYSENLKPDDTKFTGIRDYSSITQVLKVIEKYGPSEKVLYWPYLLAKGPCGELIVGNNSDDAAHLVVFDANLKFFQSICDEDIKENKLLNIRGIAVDKMGGLYVSDGKQHCIQKYTLGDGMLISQFGKKGIQNGEFDQPTGLLVSKSNVLFVCDRHNHRIQVFDNTSFLYKFGQYSDSRRGLTEPVDLTFNIGEQELFVTDCCNHRIQVYTPDGTFLRQIKFVTNHPFDLQFPSGIFFTPDNHLLVSSARYVFIFKEDGTFVSVIEGKYGEKTRFSDCIGVTMMDNGKIVVADGRCGSNRLLVF